MQRKLQPVFDDDLLIPRRHNTITWDKISKSVVRYTPLALGCIAICCIIAALYLKYTTPVYAVQAKVLIKDNNSSNSFGGQIFQDLGMQSGASPIENEIEIFRSNMLMGKVVADLNLYIRYWKKEGFKTYELYNNAYKVIPAFSQAAAAIDCRLDVSVNGNNVAVTKSGQKYQGVLGDTLDINATGKIVIARDPKSNGLIVEDFFVTISPMKPIVKSFNSALQVEAVNRQGNIIRIATADALPERGEDIINTLIAKYVSANMDDRTEVMNTSIAFIDERLAEVKIELTDIERQIEVFKRDNNIANIDEQAKALFENSNVNLKQITDKEVQLKTLESIEKYLHNSKDESKLIPSIFFVQDASFTTLIENYNNLLVEREALLISNTENSPYIKNVDKRLAAVRANVLSSISAAKRAIQANIEQLNVQSTSFGGDIKEVPTKERQYIEFARQQNIKQELYLFLLKKKEETAISQSATSTNARVVDVAQRDDAPISPNKTKTYLIALVIGIMIPATWAIGKEVTRVKILSKEDVNSAADINVIAEIGNSKAHEKIVVQKGGRTRIAEQFKALRTSVQFLLDAQGNKTVLVTSSTSGEGKSFISTNLANSLALLNKKVVLVELDLRKPAISSLLKVNNELGFSTYSIGNATVNQIIRQSGLSENLHFIPSGIIPPNPSELITLSTTAALFKELKEKFDYIIIDSAPLGLVTDATLLSIYADVMLFVARSNYTHIKQLQEVGGQLKNGQMKNVHVVLNDVAESNGTKANRGGGHGYFDVEPTNKLSRLTKIFKK